jgi:hypothetical protein
MTNMPDRPRRRCALLATILTGLALGSVPGLARAGTDASALCDRAASMAAGAHGIPDNVMHALTRAETGRRVDGRFGPWPWTLNVAGTGVWFDTRAGAEAAIAAQLAAGTTNFDIGCFQINLRWHGEAFSDPADILDPVRNADYAARFLRTLAEESGDWETAIGHYHSRTAPLAERYRTRVAAIRSGLGDAPAPPDTNDPRAPSRPTPAVLRAPQPLMAAGGTTMPGSLVALSAARRPFLDLRRK